MPTLSSTRQGFTYVLSNPAMPGLYKIGSTRKHPVARMTELGMATACPGDFVLQFYLGFDDAFEAERLTHEAFKEQRYNESKEFFAASLTEIVGFIEGLGEGGNGLTSTGERGGEYLKVHGSAAVKLPDLSFATLFATFPDDGLPRELTDDERAQCRALETRLGS